jgi:hypothetical protein
MGPENDQAKAFEQAFNPTEGPDEDVTPEPAEAQSQPEPEPEYVQITRDSYERISKAVERLPELEQQLAKRVDTAFGKIGVIEHGLRQGGGALSDEDIAPFKDDLPELYAALSKVRAPADMSALLEELTKPYLERLEATTEELRETQRFAVATVHPDWQEFTAGPKFQEWLATKDDDYRTKLNSTWSPSFIASAITEAKAFAKPKDKARSTRTEVLEAAIQPRGTGGRFVSQGTTEQDAYLAAWGN